MSENVTDPKHDSFLVPPVLPDTTDTDDPLGGGECVGRALFSYKTAHIIIVYKCKGGSSACASQNES